MACCPLPLNESFAQVRNEGGGFAEIDDEVAAVLAFVISQTTSLAAQDDEMRRTTPAKPSEPAEPAPFFCKQSRGSTPPGLTFEPLLSIEKAM